MFNQLGMEIFKVMKGESLGIKKKVLLARDEGSCQLKQRSHFHISLINTVFSGTGKIR